LWIDGLAHEATLRAGGYTIAVMGSGLNHLYPKTHVSLFNRILAQGGAILSHFPLDTLPSTYTFPLRNEIIAALSSWIFLVEARNRSGSLITAQIALDIGRDVFAAPADIGRVNSQWCNRLIQSGSAKLVLHPEDILLEYGISPKSNSIPFPPWDQGKTLEMQIAPYIGESPKTPEQIALHFGLSLQETMIHLGKLEIQGTIKASISGKYSLCYA
jgi:DNA processing protein